MKKLAKRTFASLMVVVLFLTGFSIYLARFFISGSDWAAFPVNSHVYSDGVLATGTIVDRNGEVLAYVKGRTRMFSPDYSVRRATLHVVGDAEGNIGTGLLSSFDSELMGYDIFGGVYSVSGQGNTVHSTIDARLCVTAYNALGYRNGTVVVLNYKTGDVLCMVSAPGFDPIDPPDLSEDQKGTRYEGAYINRAVSSTFTPGSIYKIITLEAAVELIPDVWEREFYCPGEVEVDGDVITCFGTHGTLDINDAFARSCNCAFAELALELGADNIRKYAEKAGLLDSFKMNGIPIAPGSFDAAPAGSADLAWSGIGQYNNLVNPLAEARFMAAIANGGSCVNPRIVYDVTNPLGLPTGLYGSGAKHRLISSGAAETIKSMMRYNVTAYYGDGRFWNLNMCAKTGTAEVGEDKTPHAWLVGFLDDPDHPYAFAVFVENGGSGISVAGDVANQVLQQAVKY